MIQAKEAVKLGHQLLKDLYILCDFFVKKGDQIEQHELVMGGGAIDSARSLDSVTSEEETLSLAEKNAKKLKPIIREILKKMIDETEKPESQNRSIKAILALEDRP